MIKRKRLLKKEEEVWITCNEEVINSLFCLLSDAAFLNGLLCLFTNEEALEMPVIEF